MKFSENIKKSIKIHSKEEFPKECCGLIVSRNKEDQIFKVSLKEKPTEEVIPKINPTREFSPVFPKAIIIIPIVAIIIDIQTLREICSFKKINAKSAVKKGIAAKHNKVIAAVVFVIE